MVFDLIAGVAVILLLAWLESFDRGDIWRIKIKLVANNMLSTVHAVSVKPLMYWLNYVGFVVHVTPLYPTFLFSPFSCRLY